jgi:hypothetical protein
MPIVELTPQLVKSAACPPGKTKIDLHDSYCKGLLLEVRNTGGKTVSGGNEARTDGAQFWRTKPQ